MTIDNLDNKQKTYAAFTPELMLQLAAPHTWVASIMPVLIATVLAFVNLSWHSTSGLLILVLLAISILFQSAVNTINDYFDYKKGTDTLENQDDPEDAVLVYNNLNPRSVLLFAVCLLILAFLLGGICIYAAGWLPLIIALIGAVILFLYSGTKTPISYLPLGELVSGITMGGLISFASYYCLTLQADARVFLWAIPVMLGIALIMMTNNVCDIEKDIIASRKTLPIVLGYENAIYLYHGLVYAWIIAIVIIVLIWYRSGWFILPFMLLLIHPIGRALIANPLKPSTRAAAFSQCISLNIALGALYAAALLASGYCACLL